MTNPRGAYRPRRSTVERPSRGIGDDRCGGSRACGVGVRAVGTYSASAFPLAESLPPVPPETDAFLVEGTNTVVVGAANGAPGLLQQALAAGTTCTFGFGTVPVLIING
jgi:hypothetical protein